MKCPRCGATEINKNGHCRGKQNYRCKSCGRQFLEMRSPKGYSEDAKQICLKMHRDGVRFRAIERVTGISHNTIINWVKQSESQSETGVTKDVSLLHCADAQPIPSTLTDKDSCPKNYELKSDRN